MDIVITDPNRRSNPYLNRITLVQGDITRQDVDAIVTFIPQNLEYRGEINRCILKEAGKKLDEFVLENIFRPRVSDVYTVPGFDLPCAHIFFCIVPIRRLDTDRPDRYLVNACRKAMETANAMGLQTIGFPPLGSGKQGFPKPRAARLMLQGILERLDGTLEEVRIVARTEKTLGVYRERLRTLSS
ncbi:MAG TPA: macro domain-containing protein [Alphaproteobacteria bacterium]|nr:macro domain-containing protein [Micavibrio sp.]MBK9563587.1 macro domain-containing protein [Micavibrio sp.]HQX27344.1 macro domain-containing protein [Alphaproteobacteria bacterium]